ncbi:hypothetical protein [Leuconostoc fallax]|uniref:hypothetical protein n=1 Tax=Leuconostoc fallax TaxID=1251 RepID=UPI001C1EB52A|nr:hypothetical protein [Leuconostoc fallax]MBU7455856.1 hypothetical protein [Leuconostoc fallax]
MEADGLFKCIEQIVEVESSTDRLGDSEFEEEIKKLWKLVSELKGSVIPYARVSQIVFKDDPNFSDDNIANVISRMEQAVFKIRSNGSLDGNLLKNYDIDKIIQNLNLASTQKSFLYNNQKSEISELKKLYFEYQNDLSKQKEDIDKKYEKAVSNISSEVDTRMNSVYAGFISVLGIFVSISFTLFGAATLLNNIFSIATRNGFNTSHDVIGSNIILAGFSTMLIYLLLIGIMQSISSVTKTRYDFSLRRIFIIFFISSGIILAGFIYKNPDMSKIKSNLLTYIIIIVVYIIAGLLLYKYGFKIKNMVLGRKNNFKIVAVAENFSLKDVPEEDAYETTKIIFSVRNKSQGQSYIDKVLMGKNQENAIRLNVESFSLLSQEYKRCEIYQNADNNELLNKSYLSDIKNGNCYLFFYTYSSVIKQKIKISNK